MGVDARLNLLLTAPPPAPQKLVADGSHAWRQTISQLLMPLGVRTFEATSGHEAVQLIEKHPIHLAVVDTRLPAISGLNVLQLIQRLQAQKRPASSPQKQGGDMQAGFQFQMHVEEHSENGRTERRIEVKFDARPPQPTMAGACGPVVILIAPPPPQQDPQLLQEALKFNAFSVLSEPVDVNTALEVMARAMKRFHQGMWPT